MDALILMTRIPIEGRTKTRLMNVFTGKQCADIHRCFLKDIFESLSSINGSVKLFLTHTTDGDLDVLKDIVPSFIECFPQSGETLGDRMKNAIGCVLDKGYSRVILIGSDIPHIKSSDILECFSLLNNNEMVISKTLDGGYYLIGMDRLYPEVFDGDLLWGEGSVYERTMSIAKNLGVKVVDGKEYMDIDTFEDIVDFYNMFNKKNLEGRIPENTLRFIKDSGVI